MCLSAAEDEQPSAGFLFVAVFLACAVEAVEALTIVLAVGVTRGWRAPLHRSSAAFLLLADDYLSTRSSPTIRICRR